MAKDTSNVSPTAHYTGWVWFKHGMSYPPLATREGRLLYHAGRPINALSAWRNGGLTLEAMLLQRHRIMDHRLTEAIERRGVTTLLEIACGMAPRGLRFAKRYPDLTVIEADLPEMAARKARAVRSLQPLNHRVVTVDALADDGADSIAAVVARNAAPTGGVAVTAEGLLGYFDADDVAATWRRIAEALQGRGGVHLANLVLEADLPDDFVPRTFRSVLHRLTRGGDQRALADDAEVAAALAAAGFHEHVLHRPIDFAGVLDIPQLTRPDVLKILEAWVHGGAAQT